MKFDILSLLSSSNECCSKSSIPPHFSPVHSEHATSFQNNADNAHLLYGVPLFSVPCFYLTSKIAPNAYLNGHLHSSRCCSLCYNHMIIIALTSHHRRLLEYTFWVPPCKQCRSDWRTRSCDLLRVRLRRSDKILTALNERFQFRPISAKNLPIAPLRNHQNHQSLCTQNVKTAPWNGSKRSPKLYLLLTQRNEDPSNHHVPIAEEERKSDINMWWNKEQKFVHAMEFTTLVKL